MAENIKGNIEDTKWKIFSTYPEIWKSMLEDIENATTSIYFEQYIFTDFGEGSVGKKFWDAFVKKARQGVKVKLLLDAQGSLYVPLRNIFNKTEENIEITYHTASTHRFKTLFKSFFREHRKLLIIDDTVAHIGGAIQQDKAMKWGELSVRFEGALVQKLSNAFLVAWHGLRQSNTFVTPDPHASHDMTVDGFTILGSSPLDTEHYIYDELVKNISQARKSIRIISPYFVPPRALWKEIKSALRRGVAVHLIQPEKIDNIVAKYVSFSFYEKFLKMGGNMYLFHEYTHGKGVIVDDTWCTFGSANMDNLALLHNYELNVGSENKEFILSLTRDFDSRVSKCRKLTLSDWRKGNIFTKILEKVAGLLKWIA